MVDWGEEWEARKLILQQNEKILYLFQFLTFLSPARCLLESANFIGYLNRQILYIIMFLTSTLLVGLFD